MPRRAAVPTDQQNFMEPTTKTGIVVPAIRAAVETWRKKGWPGVTPTTERLLNHWFHNDHFLPGTTVPFTYHAAQREAIETLIYMYEVAKVRRRKELLMDYAAAGVNFRLPSDDSFARYAVKMATGSGKTRVMAMVIAWQYLCSVNESSTDYADTFLMVAPNVIVLERLKQDFASGKIFNKLLIPTTMQRIDWDLQAYVRDDNERGASTGALYLTNIQQLYERTERGSGIPDPLDVMLGEVDNSDPNNFITRIVKRGNCLVLNDEAHHTHDENNAWSNMIYGLHQKLAAKGRDLTAQLDFSATPRYNSGQLFEWVVYDYPLKRAIIDGIVKRPIKGIATGISEQQSSDAGKRYAAYLTAGVERWQEYRKLFTRKQLGSAEVAMVAQDRKERDCREVELIKKPVLFVMMNDTKEADQVAAWLRQNYPGCFSGDKLQVIHTDRSGDVQRGELEAARKAVRDVDDDHSPINCIVSVLMLREGWDVKNVTVVVGLRPYSSKANILPEQTVGRGLRLMYPGQQTGERVDIIGSDGFLQFVEQLEQDEEIKLETFTVGKDKLTAVTVAAELPEREEYDIELPFFTPLLSRTRLEAEVITALDIDKLQVYPLPMKANKEDDESFKYEGYDFVDGKKVVERFYAMPEEQTVQELIAYYTAGIAQELKLTGQFALLEPKVREFIQRRAFVQPLDLDDKQAVKLVKQTHLAKIVTGTFVKALRPYLVDEAETTTLTAYRKLSRVTPFAWGRQTLVAQHTVYNYVVCGNDLERRFADFLDKASDVQAFAKIPDQFGFSIEYTDANVNLRHYFPDFVVRQHDPTAESGYCYWIIETKGLESGEVAYKDARAKQWVAEATEQTGQQWRYLKVPDKEFKSLAAAVSSLGEMAAVLYAQGMLL